MQTTTPGEPELLRAGAAGDTEAFGRIVERYQSLVCAITYSATGDFGKSQELAQETFLRAWRALGQLRDRDRFRTWLCRIARNVASRSIRKQRYDVINEPQPLDVATAVPAHEPDPSQMAINREHQAAIWEALQGIPEVYREPLILFYRQERSVSQVAHDLGLSESATKQRLSRGRSLLKAEIAAQVEDVLGRTGPSKVFTLAVVAALPALTAQTAAAGVAAAAAKGSSAAKSVLAAGLSGAVLGPLLGILGGLFGSWMSVRNTRSPRERRFMVRMSLLMWGEMALLFVALGLLGAMAFRDVVPKTVFWTSFAVLMTAHFVMLVPAIIWANRRQRKIQREDGTYVQAPRCPPEMSRGNIYGSLAGAIFGPVCWIIPVSFVAGDWITGLLVVLGAAAIFAVSTHSCLADSGKYWRIVILDMLGLCVLNLAAVNIRWDHWTAHFVQSPSASGYANVPLWAVNLGLVVVFGCLMLVFVAISRKQRLAADRIGTTNLQ